VAVAGAGSVVRSTDRPCLSSGESLSLHALPDAGQEFQYWTGDVTGSQNPIQVVMDGSKSIVAHFRAPGTFALTTLAEPSEAGIVNRFPDAASYAPGTHVRLTATVVGRFDFAGWSGDVTSAENSIDVVVDRDLQVVANFSVSTAVQASLVSTEVESGRVRLVWYAAELAAAVVERSAENASWAEIARLQVDGSHRFILEDANVLAGMTYRYRLVTSDAGRRLVMGETTVSIPAPARLAIGGLVWDRDFRGAAVSLTLPNRGAATIELFDVLGRQRATTRFEASAGGQRDVSFRAELLEAGMYFVRVVQGRESAARRFVLLR